jgi:hypothetical protein
MPSNLLIYELYNPCGLFNQVTSLEKGVALSYAFKRDLLIHNVVNVSYSNLEKRQGMFTKNTSSKYKVDRKGLTDESRNPQINDLLSFTPYSNAVFVDNQLENISSQSLGRVNFRDRYVNLSEDTAHEDDFSLNRTKLENPIGYDLDVRCTIGWYSAFFMNRTPEVDFGLSTVRFKPEYYELAKRIADSLGDFSGAHIRLTDNQFGYPTPKQVEAGLDSLEKHPIVIATDQPSHSTITKQNHTLLESYIQENFFKEFRELEFTDEIALGLVCNLVMHHAKDFIGSQGSTFTGYIQRYVCNDMKIFGEEDYKVTGAFTWNGYKLPRLKQYNLTVNDIPWWREWPESKLQIR